MKTHYAVLAVTLTLATGCGLFGNRHGGPPALDDEPWLTEYEAYENQTAHTGMDGGAFVVPGLKIRDPKEICREQDYKPWKYALTNGLFETRQSGEVIYRRIQDDVIRRSAWAERDGKVYLLDESGCVAHSTYGFDGYYASEDGSWDESVPRLTVETLPLTGKKYREAGNPNGPVVQFKQLKDSTFQMSRSCLSLGFTENYVLDAFGRGTYALENVKDPEIRAHLAVIQEGKTVIFSQAGATEKYILK